MNPGVMKRSRAMARSEIRNNRAPSGISQFPSTTPAPGCFQIPGAAGFGYCTCGTEFGDQGQQKAESSNLAEVVLNANAGRCWRNHSGIAAKKRAASYRGPEGFCGSNLAYNAEFKAGCEKK